MAVLKKANFQSVGISRLIKKSIMSKDQGKKLIQTSIFSKLPSLSWGFKKKVHIIEFFLHQRTSYNVDPC